VPGGGGDGSAAGEEGRGGSRNMTVGFEAVCGRSRIVERAVERTSAGFAVPWHEVLVPRNFAYRLSNHEALMV